MKQIYSGALVKFSFGVCCVIFLLTMISACSLDIPPAHCENPDTKCFINHSLESIKTIKQSISQWTSIQIFAQAIVALSGLVATVMIALQGDENKYWTRPIGLIATALVTATTSALVSFHVPDNVDKLIDVVDRITTITNEFDSKIGVLASGKNQNDINDAYNSDQVFRENYRIAVGVYAKEFNKIKIEIMRINGTAGRLNISSGVKKDGGSD